MKISSKRISLAGAAVFLSFAAPSWATPSSPAPSVQPDNAILQTGMSSSWRLSASYTHRTRPLRSGGLDWTLSGESFDGAVSFDWGWGTVTAFGGGTQAHIEDYRLEDLDMEPGGGASLRLNLWELAPARRAAWDLLVALSGRAEWRSTSDDREKLEWAEYSAFVPVEWRLFFATARGTRQSDFHALTLYAGPAGGAIDGHREVAGHRVSFREDDSFGAVGGVDLWLLDRLRLGARLEWFGDATWSLAAEYAF